MLFPNTRSDRRSIRRSIAPSIAVAVIASLLSAPLLQANQPVPSTAAPVMAPIDDPLKQARDAGFAHGYPDGGREGQERGQVEGPQLGARHGYRDGFARCEAEARRRAYDFGYRDGIRRGDYDGQREGQFRGESDGRSEGNRDGERDGSARADRDAESAATPAGRAKGREEAERSDASSKGSQDGTVAGDQQARNQAERVDYPAARQAYRDAKYAEPVQSRDSFSQKKPSGTAAAAEILGILNDRDRDRDHDQDRDMEIPAPDNRYYKPRGSYPTEAENKAYQAGYAGGYSQGYSVQYRASAETEYQRAYQYNFQAGCREAERRDYSMEQRRGYDDGYREGYRRGFDLTYRRAYDSAYRQAFAIASDMEYRRAYPAFYNTYFERARAQAYSERYQQLYDSAYEAARQARFAQAYPGYAAQAQARGRADEAADFQARPLRLISAQATEEDPNGVFEPGETIRVKFVVRNFAPQALLGRDVQIELTATNGQGKVVIDESRQLLVRDLKALSLTEVRDSFEFHLNENSVGHALRFALTVNYQGRSQDATSLEVRPRFWVETAFAEEPALSEGIARPIRFALTNASSTRPTEALALRLAATGSVELVNPEQSIGALAPGETRVIEFEAIARSPQSSVDLALALEVKGPTGRRLGLLDTTRQVPVLNDYRIVTEGSLDSMRKKGLTRVSYLITNANSRLVARGLQIQARVLDRDGREMTDASVVGPNPQFLSPLAQGYSRHFIIPVLVRSENAGGRLELAVQEDGKTVVIHRAEF